MDKSIFREKSVDSISSPDSLNDYIRVVRPSVWATLIAIILLLLCVTYWALVGRLDSVMVVAVVSDGNSTLVYADETAASQVSSYAMVSVEGGDYIINADDFVTEILTYENNREVLNLLGKPDNSEIRVYKSDDVIKSGIYKGTIVTTSIRPASLVTN